MSRSPKTVDAKCSNEGVGRATLFAFSAEERLRNFRKENDLRLLKA